MRITRARPPNARSQGIPRLSSAGHAANPTTLQDVINAALETSSSWLENGMHPLQVAMPEASLPIQADPHRLAQVFSNLLSNAAKYSDPGTPIELSVQTRDDGVVVPRDARGMDRF